MCVELRIALDCFDVLTVNVEARTDLGVRVERFRYGSPESLAKSNDVVQLAFQCTRAPAFGAP